MSRLPTQLQPLWPVVKRGHRAGARVLGAVGRRAGGVSRGLPRSASTTAAATAAAEPDAVTYHRVSAARVDQRSLPAGSPAGHWYFGTQARAEVPEGFVLELADGRLLGRHVAVVTRGGLLDAETSHYFGIADWREHPVHWNPFPSPPERFEGTLALLAARGTGHNYYHFLVDALPRLGMLDRALPGVAPDAWVVDRSTRYQRELLALLGMGEVSIIEPVPGLSLEARRLLVPSLPNASTLVTRETTEWLRTSLSPQRTGLPERLYVTRGTAPRTRRLVEEDEVFAILERRGFVRIDPGALSVQEQIDHFAAARVIVAPHGAALANLNFCRPGVRLLELFAPGYVNGGYWSIMSNIDDSRYRYLISSVGRAARPGRDMTGLMQDISLSAREVELALEELLSS